MKNIILTIIFLLGSFSFSQVEQGTYLCKYYKAYDAEDGVYNLSESEWVDVTFYFSSDFFTVEFEGEEEIKIWYEYMGEEEIEGSVCDIYETEEGGELAIDYDNQIFSYYSDYDGSTYLSLEEFSKIEIK
ncbi:MAG: hypothetical protein CBC73_05145 [Flavobacteriales bacterium TMED113]|nr:MAG: hypothetical protein CBC73_05145 [Flavobacteriales bacterium TMED113]|tara:strand:- start:110 stop:499 length:390 start_codon:yes stop_codon:yes gene_type:complete